MPCSPSTSPRSACGRSPGSRSAPCRRRSYSAPTDWVAFGSPLHLSHHYSADYSEELHSGFFGITIPSLSDLRAVLTGGTGLHLLGGGLVVRSPVTLAAGVGLLLLWRRGLRWEAAVCIAVSIALVVMNAGYAIPYGGGSPGPRFLSPMLPFLLLGLPEMLGRARWPTLALAALSIALMTQDALTWARDNHAALPDTIWSLLGAPKPVGAAIVAAVALVAGLFVCARVLRGEPTGAATERS